jgi:hypothetical protein
MSRKIIFFFLLRERICKRRLTSRRGRTESPISFQKESGGNLAASLPTCSHECGTSALRVRSSHSQMLEDKTQSITLATDTGSIPKPEAIRIRKGQLGHRLRRKTTQNKRESRQSFSRRFPPSFKYAARRLRC